MASTYTNLLYHIIFSTKERRPFINPKLLAELHPYIGGIIRDLKGEPIEIGGVQDHVHILAKLPAALALSDALREIKSNSSKWVGERPDLVRTFAWQTGYSAFTVSKSQAPTVRKYIRNQQQHHRRKSFKQELVSLLDKHEIEYDRRYLWD
jgi:REP element-mobilizing transposase RayT